MSRITKILILLLCFSLFSNFNNVSCQPDAGKDSDIDIPALLFFYIIDQEEKNSFEPNNTKETAYCLDNTHKDPSSIASISSTIYPREDIDYYKIIFKNQRLSLYHANRSSFLLRFLLETDSTIVYDSSSPESPNAMIESSQLNLIPFGNLDNIEETKVKIKDLDFVYLKILFDEKTSYPSSGGRPYSVILKNENPSITDNISRGTFLFTGEFEPCPK
jgi:hypothetical protein